MKNFRKYQFTFKVGDLIQIEVINRRDFFPRKRLPGMRRPIGSPNDGKWIGYKEPGSKKAEKLHKEKIGIVTQVFHYNSFWKGHEPSSKDNVYICYMQEYGEYYILCEDEISLVE